jgi:hypothetical protein
MDINFNMNIEYSKEHDEIILECKKIANELFEKYGPEISNEICLILNKLIDDDIKIIMQSEK